MSSSLADKVSCSNGACLLELIKEINMNMKNQSTENEPMYMKVALSKIYFVLTYLTDFTGEGEAEVMDNSRSGLRVSFAAATGVEVTKQNTLCLRLYNQYFFLY